MKTPSPGRAIFRLPNQSGVALVIVLAVLVLLTIMVVGFLNRSSTDLISSSAYYESNHNGILADTVVNLVQAQIDHAATHQEDNKPVAWASQPGMIRTFRQNGDLLRAYKLYSDDLMVAETVNMAAAVNAMDMWWDSPAHFVDMNEPGFKEDESGTRKTVYPILDNAVLDHYTIEDNGFEVDGAPLNATDTTQQIPMPVKWLYLLEDGTMVAAQGSGTTATITGATMANPVVGRVAFWTDDETTKLNINTASHGYYWDVPKVSSLEDRDRLARFQPAIREYQRYPGHPASTSLKPAFRADLFPYESAFAEFAYGIAPRISHGGSMGGTVTSSGPVTLDDDRLYSSVDELLFVPDRAEQLDPAELEMSRFFLTARSNAPEVNLYNLPRMAIWPINAGAKNASTLDKLIAFCSTINGQPYYFQREKPSSSSLDMTSFPRNEELWDYITSLQKNPVPGFGASSFESKYTKAETEQITTQIFDYIRSSNLYSTALGADAYTGDMNVLGTTGDLSMPRKPGTRVGQTTPLKIGDTKGFGRIPTISRAVLQLFISGARRVNAAGTQVGATWIPPQPPGTAAASKLPSAAEANNYIYQSWQNYLNTVQLSDKLQLLTSGIVYFDTFDPNVGYTAPRYNFQVEARFGGAWQINGQSMGFLPTSSLYINLDQNHVYDAKTNRTTNIFFSRFIGGPLGPQWMMQNYSFLRGNPNNLMNAWTVSYNKGNITYGALLSSATGASKATGYPLVSNRIPIHIPITLEGTAIKRLPDNVNIPEAERTPMINFSGGTITVRLKAGGTNAANGEVVQTYNFNFDPFTKPAPVYADNNTRSPRGASTVFPTERQFPISADFRNRWINGAWFHGFFSPGSVNLNNENGSQYNYMDLRLVQDGDIAVSVVPTLGDKRLLAAKSELNMGDDFQKHKDYDDPNIRAAIDFRADVLGRMISHRMTPGSGNDRPGKILNKNYGGNGLPDMPGHMPDGVQAALNLDFVPDFDNGPFYIPDDAYINRADEGSVTDLLGDGMGTGVTSGNGGRSVAWYIDRPDQSAMEEGKNNESFFSPARQMPSAAKFGSLPTGVKRNLPWQTLLFRPDPGGHPGATSVPDYALLDLFWMPVVEPYAISEPFSSNGKVNMNYQIAPFSYITRANALHGVLLSEEMLAIPDDQVNIGNNPGNPNVYLDVVESSGQGSYKAYSADDGVSGAANRMSSHKFRKKINIAETLKGFQHRFDDNRIFRSESEVCSLSLIPEDETWNENFESWWDDYRLTGDNSREQPYTHLLPRLTTKSNTYTVHFRVQRVKKRTASSDAEAASWDESRDRVTSEYRGSRTIERYIDPNDKRIPNYAKDMTAGELPSQPLSKFYRWRTLANREFAP